MGSLGVILAVASGILLLFPDVIIPTWPWTLSPLTARVMSAMFALSGTVAIGVAHNRQWDAARIPLQAQALAIILILIGMIRASSEISPASWGSWLFIAGLLMVLSMIVWANIEGRRT